MHSTSRGRKSTSRAKAKVDSISLSGTNLNGAKNCLNRSTLSKTRAKDVSIFTIPAGKKIEYEKKSLLRKGKQLEGGNMISSTPIILFCGYLGSGKTTVLSHLLGLSKRPRVAILMNEFGEVSVDTAIIKGRNVHIKELLEGCVCCSLVGEFKAAVLEIIDLYHPDYVVVETTGIAEADNLILDTSSIPRVRLHSIVSVVDAHLVSIAAHLGHNITLQIKAADVLVLNKIDLVPAISLVQIQNTLHGLNPHALLVSTIDGKIGWDVVLGVRRLDPIETIASKGVSREKYVSSYVSYCVEPKIRTRTQWKTLLLAIPMSFERVKGVIRIGSSSYILNYVRGQYTLVSCDADPFGLVVIGQNITLDEVTNFFC